MNDLRQVTASAVSMIALLIAPLLVALFGNSLAGTLQAQTTQDSNATETSTEQETAQQDTAEQTSTQQENDHPLANCTSGIQWVFSLDDARAKAKAEGKLVLLKPVAYRSIAGSEKLSPSAEAMRAMVMVDPRVVNLINRRFVPYYFDMDNLGSEFDPVASELAMKLFPEMRFMASMATPPWLVFQKEEKLVGQASNFLNSDELLAALSNILDENVAFKLLNQKELAATDPVEKAKIFYELRQLDDALAALDKQQSSEAFYLKGLIAREREEWADMKAAFRMVTDTNRKMDMKVDNLIRYWKINNLEGIKALAGTVSSDNPRFQEAMYLLGLAYFHSDETEKAIEIWKMAIKHNPKSCWAYRLDWTQGLAAMGPSQFSTDVQPSEFGIRYLNPDGNPDLLRRR